MRSVPNDPPVLARLFCQRFRRKTASSSTPAAASPTAETASIGTEHEGHDRRAEPGGGEQGQEAKRGTRHEKTTDGHEGLGMRTGHGMRVGRRGTAVGEFRRAHIYNRRMPARRDPELSLSRSPNSRLLLDRWSAVPVGGGKTGTGSA